MEGYSEYNITDMTLEDYSIGGHNLIQEFESHTNQYCHFLIEA